MMISTTKPYLIIGAGGQVGQDVCAYFERHDIKYKTVRQRLKNTEDVRKLIFKHRDHQVLNFAFDKTLNNTFINIDLPAIIEGFCDIPPVHLSSNSVYGLQNRVVGTGDTLDPSHIYSRQKIQSEQNLHNTHIVRGSFLSTSHRIFSMYEPRINADSLWNGITTFEFARLLTLHLFTDLITTVASTDIITWGELADHFQVITRHDPTLPNNRCILKSDLPKIQTMSDQFIDFQSFIANTEQ